MAPTASRSCSRCSVGMQVFDEDRETLIHDFTSLGEKFVLAEGGNGGFGNAHFKSSTNRAPRNANRPAGRGALDLAAAEVDRGRRSRRPPQWEIDPLGRQRGQAKDRRLSLTTLHPQLGGECAGTRIRARRYSRADRRLRA